MMKLIVASIALLFCFTPAVNAQVSSPANRTRTIARDLSFRPLNGDTQIRMSDYENQTIVIVIWASWCPPCRLALTELEKLKRQSFSKDPFPMIALSIEDPKSAEADVKQAFEIINYTDLSGWIDEKAPLVEGRNSIPQILIVKNLTVLKRFIGWRPQNLTDTRKVLTAAKASR